ncbi:PREDICTED: PRUPE_2G216600 [Prunus dulcis]|uniref:PREDICTED: PRUPE_2G216600 n=1 Tax=Prunus dulcis TaxID=3755 RepID=A0A5E4FI19_PRUDU|nr:PREDICTED: PRUPE_2G216600 [Prunus dulcis]
MAFEHSRPSPDIAITESQTAYSEFTNAHIHNNVIHGPPAQNISPTQWWMLPYNDFVKVNVDASWKQGFSGPTNASSSIEAETSVILEGCKFALLHEGLNIVIIESDTREAISSVHGSITKGRTANLAADYLAKLSSLRMRSFVWVDRPPSSLTSILNKDGLPCPPPQNS